MLSLTRGSSRTNAAATAPRRRRPRAGSRPQADFRPRLEPLEARRLLAAHVFEVTSTADDGPGSLREAIEMANAQEGADVIRFARRLDSAINLSSELGSLNITDDLTIRGPGADRLTVNGGGETRVFAIFSPALADNPFVTPTLEELDEAPEVTISGLTITGGKAENALGFDPTDQDTGVFSFGGGIYNMGGTLHLHRVTMTGNTAQGVVSAGGAVANEFGGTLTVSHSHFGQNTAAGLVIGVGGALTSDVGPVANEGTASTDQPHVTVRHSSFHENQAVATFGDNGDAFAGLAAGGAIVNVTGVLAVAHSEFDSNNADAGADAGEGKARDIPGLANPTRGGLAQGGAISSGNVSPFGEEQSRLHVVHSRFEGNTAHGGHGSDDDLPGGTASGGAVAVSNGGQARLTRNRFLDNAAVGGDGGSGASGGVGFGGGVSVSALAEVRLRRNVFADNRASGGSTDGMPSATGAGGGLALHRLDVAGFKEGPADAHVHGDAYRGNTAWGGIGGGIFNDGDLTLRRSTVVRNTAEGLPEVTIDFVPDYVFQGAALGGGISNIGTLDVTSSTLAYNAAVGANEATGTNVLGGDPEATYPGLAVGGGLHTIDNASVRRSRIIGNEAVGGDNNSGSFAGVANGGGIYNDGSLRVDRSRVSRNRAVGGNGNGGDINLGGAYGAGVASGSVAALEGARSAQLEISRSQIRHNQAIGGEGNGSGLTLPPAHAANGATGGGVLVYQGEATIDRTQITHNRAQGGVGGQGAGGGVFFFGFVGAVNAQMTNSLVVGNSAVGGLGGDGIGGGVATGSLGSLLAISTLNPEVPISTEVDIARSLIFANEARGGAAAEDDDASVGSDGLGGGIYNGSDASLELTRSLVFRNRALGGGNGEGVGGGVYNLGQVHAVRSRIFANYASTSDDNRSGF